MPVAIRYRYFPRLYRNTDTFFIYDPDRNLEPQRQFPFATIVTKDYGDFDKASNLNRLGVFRLNIGVSRDTYESLFGPHPAPAGESSALDTGHDFTALDQLMPHPVYAPQSWICFLNQSDSKFQEIKPFLAEAYDLAVKRTRSRLLFPRKTMNNRAFKSKCSPRSGRRKKASGRVYVGV